jgi:hypothetical protein
MDKTKSPNKITRPTNIEMAGEMYETAFIIKKQKFSLENPKLSEAELNHMTAKYLREQEQK